MATIRISADSTCDLSREIIEKFNISIIPLTVISGSESFKDGVDISAEQIFERTEKSGKLCSTSAVNVYDYTEYFKKVLETADEMVHISLSSELSTSCHNAFVAAEEFGGRVVVIDSKNLSTGIGHIVYEAALMAQSGMPLKEMETKLNELTERVESSFIIDQLDYLKRGGRCSALMAFGASVLKIKPCIDVIGGKMTVGQTYRGSYEKCLRRYVKDRLEGRDDIVNDRIFITRSSEMTEEVELVKKLIEEYGNFKEIIPTRAGCTICCHCGPNTLGILFVRSK